MPSPADSIWFPDFSGTVPATAKHLRDKVNRLERVQQGFIGIPAAIVAGASIDNLKDMARKRRARGRPWQAPRQKDINALAAFVPGTEPIAPLPIRQAISGLGLPEVTLMEVLQSESNTPMVGRLAANSIIGDFSRQILGAPPLPNPDVGPYIEPSASSLGGLPFDSRKAKLEARAAAQDALQAYFSGIPLPDLFQETPLLTSTKKALSPAGLDRFGTMVDAEDAYLANLTDSTEPALRKTEHANRTTAHQYDPMSHERLERAERIYRSSEGIDELPSTSEGVPLTPEEQALARKARRNARASLHPPRVASVSDRNPLQIPRYLGERHQNLRHLLMESHEPFDVIASNEGVDVAQVAYARVRDKMVGHQRFVDGRFMSSAFASGSDYALVSDALSSHFGEQFVFAPTSNVRRLKSTTRGHAIPLAESINVGDVAVDADLLLADLENIPSPKLTHPALSGLPDYKDRFARGDLSNAALQREYLKFAESNPDFDLSVLDEFGELDASDEPGSRKRKDASRGKKLDDLDHERRGAIDKTPSEYTLETDRSSPEYRRRRLKIVEHRRAMRKLGNRQKALDARIASLPHTDPNREMLLVERKAVTSELGWRDAEIARYEHSISRGRPIHRSSHTGHIYHQTPQGNYTSVEYIGPEGLPVTVTNEAKLRELEVADFRTKSRQVRRIREEARRLGGTRWGLLAAETSNRLATPSEALARAVTRHPSLARMGRMEKAAQVIEILASVLMHKPLAGRLNFSALGRQAVKDLGLKGAKATGFLADLQSRLLSSEIKTYKRMSGAGSALYKHH